MALPAAARLLLISWAHSNRFISPVRRAHSSKPAVQQSIHISCQPGSQQQTRRTAIDSYLLSAGLTAANPPYSNRFISPVSRAHSSKPNLSPHEPANCRTISNLCTFSKVPENLLLSRLQPHVMRSANYCKFQSAYRKSHSTETALLRVINDIRMAAGNDQCTAACVGAQRIINVRCRRPRHADRQHSYCVPHPRRRLG